MKQALMDRFIRYVQVDTQSDSFIESCPSTPGQLVLARMLAEELKELGVEEVTLDENGYVMATLPATDPQTAERAPVIGFIAHLDTATELTGKNVRPRVIEAYDGGDLPLDPAGAIVLSPAVYSELSGYAGQTLIVTDGSTLLGADDKAGVAEIVTALEQLLSKPDVRHGKIRIAFTPDEEIGRGASRFDVAAFGADFAYTVDGGPLGELQYENFNAASAKIVFHGRNVHPGSSKGRMINSAKMALAYIAQLPDEESPEYTDDREGFYHLFSIEGDVEKTELLYLIREFDREKYEERKEMLREAAAVLQARYGAEAVSVDIQDRYFNMHEKIQPMMGIVDLAREAMEAAGIEPLVRPIRGGTDGARLSFMGLPTPNLFAGGENFHSRYEYISVESMEKATQTLVELARLAVGRELR